MENLLKGPLLTDSEFFDALDGGVPALNKAKELFANGDKESAYATFLEHIKAIYQPQRFYRIRGREAKPQFTDSLREAAERAMNHLMISCGVPMQFGDVIIWDSNPTPNKYKEWRWQLCRHPEALALSRAYRATGEKKYVDEAISMLLSWIEQAPREPYDGFPYDDTLWRTIECGIRLIHWCEIIYSAIEADAFTPDSCVTIFKSVYEHCKRLTTRYTHGNWLMMEMNGVALTNMLFPVFNESEEWANAVIDKLTASICHQIYPDGAQYELAPSYQGVVLSNAASIEQIFGVFDKKFPEEYYEAFRRSFDFFAKIRMADGMIPPINDSPMSNADKTINNYSAYYGCSELAKWVANGGKVGTAPDFNSVLIPYAGFTVFRSGWGDGQVTAFFDGGKFGRDHNHEDKLNFLIYDSEGPLLYEMGVYAYDNSPYRIFALKSQGHNVILVDGCSQNRLFTKNWSEASYTHDKEPTLFYENDELVYTSAVFDDNYGYEEYDGKAPSKCATHKRSVIMLKADEPRDTLYLVLDEMTSLDGEEHTYDALWHLNFDGISLLKNAISSDRLSFISCGFDSMLCERGIVDGPKPRGIISPTSVQNKFYPAPQLTLSKRGKDCKMATLFSHRSLELSPVESISFEGETVTLTLKNGKLRTFNLTELESLAKKDTD